MERKDIENLVHNEAEWRRFILQEVAEIKKTQTELVITATTLKVKFGMIGVFFGGVSGLVSSLVLDFLKTKH